MAVEEVELGSRPVQRIDLVALSFLPSPRHQIAAAVACADAADGRLDTALEWLDHADAAADLRRRAREALDTSGKLGLGYLALDEPGYPALLSSLTDPPIGLWVRGQLPDRPCVAIIGSRVASSAALEIAHGLAASLARRGLCVVSGLARGCDGRAHQGALDGGGETIAVLGCGLDQIYPAEHGPLADAVAAHGAVISEFPPGTPPLPPHFPLRNRIISGLSRAVIVVEAGEKSGSLITAGCALEQGREVMVVPGPVLSGRNRGAHALLRDGATLVESADDVLRALSGAMPWLQPVETPEVAAASSANDDPVLAALDVDEPRDVDDIVARTSMAPAAILVRLTELEIDGLAARQPGARFVRRLL
jgi:DNA processing protein